MSTHVFTWVRANLLKQVLLAAQNNQFSAEECLAERDADHITMNAHHM